MVGNAKIESIAGQLRMPDDNSNSSPVQGCHGSCGNQAIDAE